MKTNKLKVGSTYEEFVLYNRIRTNFALNIILWGCVLVGPALAVGIKFGIYDLIQYKAAGMISLLLVALAAVHTLLYKKQPGSVLTGLFAIISLDLAVVFLIRTHANISMTIFLVPLIALFFCDRIFYLVAVVLNYIVLMWAEWTIADFAMNLRTDMDSAREWMIYISSGYLIETIILGAVGYALCLEINKYFHGLYDSQNELQDRDRKIVEQLEILNAISDIYGHIGIVNLKDRTVTNINSIGQTLETTEIDASGMSEINKGMIPILNSTDVNAFAEFTNLNTLADRMKNRTVIYKEFDSRLIGWFRAQYISITGLEDQFIYTIQDIDDVKRKEESLVKISNTDELTKLFNRRAYEEELKSIREKGISDNLILFSVDINGLKQVNDSLGHLAGDELIVGAAKCVKSALNLTGKAFRTGGDEFQILIDTDESAEEIKARILEAADNWKGKNVDSLAMSIGYATARDNPGCRIEELEKKADEQMYRSKSRFYREKGIDRRGQKAAYDTVCDTYTKILRVNLTSDRHQIINTNEAEKVPDKGYSESISEWIKNFGQSGQVHPDDLENYLEKTDTDYLKKYFDAGHKYLSIFYRRKIDDNFKQVMMEIIPSAEYSSDYQDVFLYVKDIDR